MPSMNSTIESLPGVARFSIFLLVVLAGVWGCAGRTDPNAGARERIRVLESRCQKLEQDYRGVASTRDKIEKQLAELKAENARFKAAIEQQNTLVKERDELAEQLKTALAQLESSKSEALRLAAERDELKSLNQLRLAERDQLNQRVERLRKGLEELLSTAASPTAVGLSSNGPSLPGE